MRPRYRFDVEQLYENAKSARRSAKCLREICGILVYNHNDIEMIPVRNSSPYTLSFEMTRHFSIIAIRKSGIRYNGIIGAYHSHILAPAQPGESDIAGASDNKMMLIFDSLRNKVRLWHIRKGKARPLLLLRQRRS